MLYQVWCSYHSYVRKAIRIKILSHHNGPFCHHQVTLLAFLEGLSLPSMVQHVAPTFLRCWALIVLTLVYCFLVGWPYSSSCGGTCKDQYLSFLNHITGYLCNVTWGHLITCLAFWKSSSVILYSNAIFFDGSIIWAGIYFASNRCSFECCANMFSFLCRSNNKGLVINSS
jgi:hypothetical protein